METTVPSDQQASCGVLKYEPQRLELSPQVLATTTAPSYGYFAGNLVCRIPKDEIFGGLGLLRSVSPLSSTKESGL